MWRQIGLRNSERLLVYRSNLICLCLCQALVCVYSQSHQLGTNLDNVITLHEMANSSPSSHLGLARYKIQDTRKLYYLKREINTWIMLSLSFKNYESLHNTETKNVCTQSKLYKTNALLTDQNNAVVLDMVAASVR